MIAGKIKKVIAALGGEAIEEPVTAATVEQALDELAEAILANPILNPKTKGTEETSNTEETTQTEETTPTQETTP